MFNHETMSATRAVIITEALNHYLMDVLNDPAGATEDGKHCIDLMCLFDIIAEELECNQK